MRTLKAGAIACPPTFARLIKRNETGDGRCMPNRAVWAQVDLSAIEHNMKEIRDKVRGNAKVCAVVKADGYGHGAVAVAKAAVKAGADYLAVAMLSEALELRSAGLKEAILILGYTPPEQSTQLAANDIEQTVFTLAAAKALSEAAGLLRKTAKVHLKIDTGMGRIGVPPAEAGILAEQIAALPHLKLQGIFSHLATADSEDKTFAYAQLARFKEAIGNVVSKNIEIPIKHLANSAAILEMPETHFDMVRAGIILYGLWPSDEVKKSIHLWPAMQFKTKIAYIKKMPPKQSISYGAIFETKRDSVIATLPLGYADGYTRLLTGKAEVLIKGQRAPVVGKICMDQCMVDVTDIGDAAVGDEVVLFGNAALPADEIARLLGTINYEVICMVGKRVPRFYD